MSTICACCFGIGEGGESPRCPACKDLPCPDCKADKVLLEHTETPEDPLWNSLVYEDFLHRFEGQILPAYQDHFANDVRQRWKTRLEVGRAMVFAQAML